MGKILIQNSTTKRHSAVDY